jgi:hypothetical protein
MGSPNQDIDNEYNRLFYIHDMDANGIPELIVQMSNWSNGYNDVYTITNNTIQFLGQSMYLPQISSDSNFPGIFATLERQYKKRMIYDSIQDGEVVLDFVNLWDDTGHFGEYIYTVIYESSNSALVKASRSIEPLNEFIGRVAIMEELGSTLILNTP